MGHKSIINNKTILITGGAGFIGSHLAENLNDNNTIFCIDNYLTGKKENHIDGVNYISGNVADISSLMSGVKVDYIFHLGEYSRVEQSLSEPEIALSNSYRTFSSVLEFWRNSGAKLIYSGSSTKFAKDTDGQALSPYTAAKALNSQLLVNYANWYSLPFSIVYFYNVYGGRELTSGRYCTVIGKFKQMVSDGAKSLPVREPGSQRRNFTHIDDIVSGIVIAASSGNGDGYGIGAAESYSILDLCEMFQCSPKWLPGTSSNRHNGILHVEKIKDLGWEQKHQLMTHIRQFQETNFHR